MKIFRLEDKNGEGPFKHGYDKPCEGYCEPCEARQFLAENIPWGPPQVEELIEFFGNIKFGCTSEEKLKEYFSFQVYEKTAFELCIESGYKVVVYYIDPHYVYRSKEYEEEVIFVDQYVKAKHTKRIRRVSQNRKAVLETHSESNCAINAGTM